MTSQSLGFLGDQVQLVQSQTGYRAGLDAALLASALSLPIKAQGLEMGCGPGAALLSAARLNEQSFLTGIEMDFDAVKLARKNIAINTLEDRVSLVNADALAWRPDNLMDAVFFNPPYFDDPETIRGPKPDKHNAWINKNGLERWIEVGLKRLREGGVLTLIHRAERLGDILKALGSKAGDIQVQPIHPRQGQPASRVLVAARKVSKAPLQIHPGLILHTQTGSGFTKRADALLRGQTRLALLSP